MATSKPLKRKRTRVQAVIPEDRLPRLREVMDGRGYCSLSEHIRDLIRRYIGIER